MGVVVVIRRGCFSLVTCSFEVGGELIEEGSSSPELMAESAETARLPTAEDLNLKEGLLSGELQIRSKATSTSSISAGRLLMSSILTSLTSSTSSFLRLGVLERLLLDEMGEGVMASRSVNSSPGGGVTPSWSRRIGIKTGIGLNAFLMGEPAFERLSLSAAFGFTGFSMPK